MHAPPTASVVVPTFRRATQLARCIDALAAQRSPSFEIIVVDDGSADGTTQSVLRDARHVAAGLRALTHAENRGPAAARNTGLAAARGEIVAFTDDDCEPEPSWLAELVRALERATPDVVGVGGRVESARPGLVGEYMTRQRILEPPPSLAYLVTANCAFRRAPVIGNRPA